MHISKNSIILPAFILFSLNAKATLNEESLRNAFIDSAYSIDEKERNTLGLINDSLIKYKADVFSKNTSFFDTADKLKYEGNYENMAISSLLGDVNQVLKTSTDEELISAIMNQNDEDVINAARELSKNIVNKLALSSQREYKENGITINLLQELKTARNWDSIARKIEPLVPTWKSSESNLNWGLNKTNAYNAYAMGMSGKGVNVGIIDSGIKSSHRDFKNLNILTAEGVYYEDNNKYDKHGNLTGINKKGEKFSISGEYDPEKNDGHGTEMSGVLASSRNGLGSHGVAFNSNLFVTSTGGSDDNSFQGSEDLDYNVFKSIFEELNKNNVSLVNESWGQASHNPVENDFGTVGNADSENISAIMRAYRPFWDRVQRGSKTWLNAMIEAGQKYNFVQIVSNGNSSSIANPGNNANAPYFNPEIESKWVAVTGYDITDAQVYNRCGTARWWCVMAPTGEPSTHPNGGFTPNANGTSAAAPFITGSLALIQERFPYMSPSQVRDVLLTTSTLKSPESAQAMYSEDKGLRTYSNLTPLQDYSETAPKIPNAISGWGLPDLNKAMKGPAQFLGAFSVNIPGGYRDIWSNDISDEAIKGRRIEDEIEQERWKMRKREKGWENGISANSSADDKYEYAIGTEREQATYQRAKDPLTNLAYVGSLIKDGEGELVLSGENTYTGSTWVKGGTLTIDGSVLSQITVDGNASAKSIKDGDNGKIKGGILSGTGTVNKLVINEYGSVSPGHNNISSHDIGLLTTGDITLNSGSNYIVNIDRNGHNDAIYSKGSIDINNANIVLLSNNNENYLAGKSNGSILDKNYTIIKSKDAINGTFTNIYNNYKFIDSYIHYLPNEIVVNLKPNEQTLISIAKSKNEKSIAKAISHLSVGDPVLESVIYGDSAENTRNAYNNLSGQIHADIASEVINSNKYFSDAINERVRQAEGQRISDDLKHDMNGAWVKLLGGWGRTSSDSNAEGFKSSTYGFVIGMDKAIDENKNIGIATGYTRTSLHENSSANAKSENYYLGVYGGMQLGNLAFRGGLGNIWHRIDTSRDVKYDIQFDHESAKYSANSIQGFMETGYQAKFGNLNLEPYTNITYLNYTNKGFSENGNAAALSSRKDHTDVLFSTTGVRANSDLYVSKTTKIGLNTELGWVHNFGNLDRGIGLQLGNTKTPFTVDSVPVSREGILVKVGSDISLSSDKKVSLGYTNVLSKKHQSDSLKLDFSWSF
ncbi:autotransporter domain-containing protein [Klebsiella pneumoniae]